MQARSTRAPRLLAVMALLVVAGAAQAQGVYRCAQGGRVVMSDRPCTTGAGSGLGAIGPAPAPAPMPVSRYANSYVPPPVAPKAVEHLHYLNPACAELNEAIRTAPSRGIRGQGLRDLHDEYQRSCRTEDRLARQQLSREQSAKESAELELRERQARAETQAREQAELVRAQCAEMRRTLADRRQRAASLSEGEQADLRRAEDRFKQRCTGA